jgi:hypothetical protein
MQFWELAHDTGEDRTTHEIGERPSAGKHGRRYDTELLA